MSDSFFTTRNSFDDQLEKAQLSPRQAEEVLEAAVRRISERKGPLFAAERVQRIADICAGAYVLPPEHWQMTAAKIDTPSPPAAKPKKRGLGALLARVATSPVLWFWVGYSISQIRPSGGLW